MIVIFIIQVSINVQFKELLFHPVVDHCGEASVIDLTTVDNDEVVSTSKSFNMDLFE
jgi:hypothetical protein